ELKKETNTASPPCSHPANHLPAPSLSSPHPPQAAATAGRNHQRSEQSSSRKRKLVTDVEDGLVVDAQFDDTPPHLRQLAAVSQSGDLPSLRLALSTNSLSLCLLFFLLSLFQFQFSLSRVYVPAF
ncbi:hypothetical protein SOVF_168110, partial [Spinacia oleracea]